MSKTHKCLICGVNEVENESHMCINCANRNNNEAKKFDAGKPRMDLLPFESLEEVAKVYTMGAVKYGDHNWRKGMQWSRVFAAILRHLFAYWMGEDVDKESGLSHVAHACWGCLTLISYAKTNTGTDDRWRSENNDK